MWSDVVMVWCGVVWCEPARVRAYVCARVSVRVHACALTLVLTGVPNSISERINATDRCADRPAGGGV